jgi:hypothetical protein
MWIGQWTYGQIDKVQASETVDISAMSETIITVQIMKTGELEDSTDNHIVMIELDINLVEKYFKLMH